MTGGFDLRLCGFVLVSFVVQSCVFFSDEPEEYLKAGSVPPLQFPQDLDSSRVRPLLDVPPIGATPVDQLVEFNPDDPRPASLFGATEDDYIKIQRLGERYWLVIDEDSSTVWPRVKQFLVDNGVPVEAEDPAVGMMRSGWITLSPNDTDVVRKGITEMDAGAARARLFVRVESGIRATTTEVHLRYSVDSNVVATWPDKSQAVTVEDKLLNELGGYLASIEVGPAISFLAQGIATSAKSSMTKDEKGVPALRFDLDFDRAWATVGQALSRAEINVTDLNRDQGIFYVDVTELDLEGEEEGFFDGWFSDDDEPFSLQLKMTPQGSAHLLAVSSDSSEPPPNEFVERLLMVLRENAG